MLPLKILLVGDEAEQFIIDLVLLVPLLSQGGVLRVGWLFAGFVVAATTAAAAVVGMTHQKKKDSLGSQTFWILRVVLLVLALVLVVACIAKPNMLSKKDHEEGTKGGWHQAPFCCVMLDLG